MAKETATQTSNETPWSVYNRSMMKFNAFLSPAAKIISSNLATLTGHPHGTANWEKMSVIEKQPYLDLAEKVAVSFKAQMPKRPTPPKS